MGTAWALMHGKNDESENSQAVKKMTSEAYLRKLEQLRGMAQLRIDLNY
jgi:hypothetical protein